MLNLYCKLIWL